ncbi:carboxylating nicotinate-nucleotide diphosphorylase [Methanogenium organophilum]|uniref:Nicotinate-nucleotide pyrophosphorylase [carboxylating] n=1 Tax=Methanogenium organophilum TaxID=2199 RepID=A0A9X9S6U5_METOG|nr:carboxylating nicotinate-nucleotide diphosphorylase [Methanogenium organophilum]WAI01940.1 carboxylating nicotinate-nucleotide diphosphorylase [Methanogenium organophilum]
MQLREDLLRYLNEDIPFGDVTSRAVIPDRRCAAYITGKENAIISGLAEAEALCNHCDITFTRKVSEGAEIRPGTVIAELAGTAAAILMVERTMLNLMSRMSGIATATRRAVRAAEAANPAVRIAGTRKTAPGLRLCDKKALITGGADPHRMSLSDMILIKDNHLALVPLEDAVKKARAYSRYVNVEVEVETASDALTAARAGADIILLDNMLPRDVQETLDILTENNLREQVIIEVSGNITPDTLESYAVLGIDTISMGRLTHTVKNIDLSLEIMPAMNTVKIF